MNVLGSGRLVLPPLVFLSSLLLACSNTPQWSGFVEVRDGVEVVLNPGAPLLDEAQNFVSDLWALESDNWVDPSLVHAELGLVTVVDPPGGKIHVVTSSGETKASLGQSGGGPGEFLRIRDAFRIGDRLAVLDYGKSSIEYLSFDGEYLSSFHLGGQVFGAVFPLKDDEMLVSGRFFGDPTDDTQGFWIIKEGSDPIAFPLQPLELLPEEGVECSELFSWANGAARLRQTTPQIQVMDRAGDLLFESRIDLPIEVITEAERQSALSELRSRLATQGLPPEYIQQNLVVSEERWRVKCRFGPLRFDSSGLFAAFLEQNPDDFGSGNATLHFLSPEGVYLAKTSFPAPWRDFTLDDGVIYALQRDPITDVVSLRAISVDLPESLFANAAEVLSGARNHATGAR